MAVEPRGSQQSLQILLSSLYPNLEIDSSKISIVLYFVLVRYNVQVIILFIAFVVRKK